MAAERQVALRHICLLALAYSLPFAAASLPLFADITVWQHEPATSGNWFDGANWSAGVPGPEDDPRIRNGGTAEILSGIADVRQLQLADCDDASGHLIQTGGLLEVEHNLSIAPWDNTTATYTLTGTGDFIGRYLGIGGRRCPGPLRAAFLVSGGASATLETVQIKFAGTGGYFQTGGLCHVTDLLEVREDALCDLAGGVLEVERLLVYGSSDPSPSEESGFRQRGGSCTVGQMETYANSVWELKGGVFHINQFVNHLGHLDFGDAAATLTVGDGAGADLSHGAIAGHANASMVVGDAGWALFPAGFDPYVEFASYSSAGLTHVGGTTLTIPAGFSMELRGDFPDHVVCAGSLTRQPIGSLTLRGGIEVMAGGIVDCGYVCVDDSCSGLSEDGSLAVVGMSVGLEGIGRFAMPGGRLTVEHGLHVGPGRDSDGTFELGPGGTLVAGGIFVGGSGAGRFFQTGGTCDVGRIEVACGSRGDFVLSGGHLRTETMRLGDSGRAAFVHNAGHVTVADTLTVGHDTISTYELNGGSLGARTLRVGYRGPGIFTHTAGTNTIAEDLIIVGKTLYYTSRYELSGTGHVTASSEHVGYGGAGEFVQNGGTNTTTFLEVGPDGLYQWKDGTFEVVSMKLDGDFDLGHSDREVRWDPCFIHIGDGGFVNARNVSLTLGDRSLLILPPGGTPGRFQVFHNAGITHTEGTTLVIPAGRDVPGIVGAIPDPVECAGTLTAPEGGWIDLPGGLTIVDGGSVDLGTGDLTVDEGTSSLGEGALKVETLSVGENGTGTFNQTGGTNTVTHTLNVGVWSGSYGGYTISAGVLITADCILGEGGTGILGIESASADIVISGRMKFGPGAQIASVPGGTIRFTGSAFENESTDPAAMAGLANVTMQFEGGPGVVDPFEVAGRDDGPVASAWTENFAVGTLKVGDSGTVGNVRFVDTFDNQPGHEGGEAQYLHSLEIAAGSSLDQNGLNVYVDGGFANAGTLNVTTAGLTVLYTGASPFGAIYADVTSGCNGGTWDGPGITSSAAPAHPQGLAALGVLDDGEKVIVDYTWAGDANLDGVLDSNDYDRIDTAWVLWRAEGIVPEGGFRWAVGDFDYDNTIDSNDYDLIDRAWTLSEGAPLGGNAPVPTPEPATLVLLAAGALALLARRPAHQ